MNCRIEVKDMNYYYISVIIFAAFVIFAAGTIVSLSIEVFNTVITVKRQKNKAFYQITLLAHYCIFKIFKAYSGRNKKEY